MANTFDCPEKLSGSISFSDPEIIQRMTDVFDKTTKLRFRKLDEPSYIKFGTVRYKDPKYDIRSGRLKLAGFVHVLRIHPEFMFFFFSHSQDVADLFEPSINAITEAFEKQRRVTSTPITVSIIFINNGYCHVMIKFLQLVFLIGSFAASDWLFTKLHEYFHSLGIIFCRPDYHM